MDMNQLQRQQPMMPRFPMPMQMQESQFPAGEMAWLDTKDQIGNMLIPPNQSRVFFSKTEPVFYVATSDKMGLVSVSTYGFSEIKETTPEEKFITRDELKNILADLLGNKEVHNESAIQQGNATPTSNPQHK